jgi:hypothetical protein
MPRERAKSFAERLPPIIPRDEDDISHLSDEMAEILYPGSRKHAFRMEVVFDAFAGEVYERALSLARRSPFYRESREGEILRHHAAFETRGSLILRDLFELVGSRAGTDVLVDGRKAPYAREIWLPLFWVFPGTQE